MSHGFSGTTEDDFMITPQDRKWHDIYGGLPVDTRDTVDELFQEIKQSMKDNFMQTAGDDRAEVLVAAIARYVVECGNNEPED